MNDMDITSTTCDDVDEKFDIDDENWDHYWNTLDVVEADYADVGSLVGSLESTRSGEVAAEVSR